MIKRKKIVCQTKIFKIERLEINMQWFFSFLITFNLLLRFFLCPSNWSHSKHVFFNSIFFSDMSLDFVLSFIVKLLQFQSFKFSSKLLFFWFSFLFLTRKIFIIWIISNKCVMFVINYVNVTQYKSSYGLKMWLEGGLEREDLNWMHLQQRVPCK